MDGLGKELVGAGLKPRDTIERLAETTDEYNRDEPGRRP
jgi:hypothetical protein